MANDKPTILILFQRKAQNYRMRVALVHVHPGERDHVEVSSKDMMGNTAWNPVPDGSSKIPSPEWVIRRAIWHLLEQGFAGFNLGLCKPNLQIDIGEI